MSVKPDKALMNETFQFYRTLGSTFQPSSKDLISENFLACNQLHYVPGSYAATLPVDDVVTQTFFFYLYINKYISNKSQKSLL